MINDKTVKTHTAEENERDAKRFRHLVDHHSYRYNMTFDSPMKCGLACGYQPLTPDKQGWSLEDFIDEEIGEIEKEEKEGNCDGE